MIYTTNYVSTVGKILLAANESNALTGLWIEGQKYYLASFNDKIISNDNAEIFIRTKQWLDRYFAGEKPPINELNIAPSGSVFRKTVWGILCRIPYGTVVTYGEISKEIAALRGIDKMSAQAVGGAVGHNPISIIVPCHRVVGSGGNLTGYAGGIDKKIKLLEHEGVDVSRFFVPKKGTAL